VPLMCVIVYEVLARYLFTAPTRWAYDISRMLYGAMFVLGAAYALSKGVHIRADFIYRRWSAKTQGWVDTLLYLVCYFPTMGIFLWVSTEWAWIALSRGERATDTAWMPLLGPLKSCVPIGIAFLILQGISELLKSVHAARTALVMDPNSRPFRPERPCDPITIRSNRPRTATSAMAVELPPCVKLDRAATPALSSRASAGRRTSPACSRRIARALSRPIALAMRAEIWGCTLSNRMTGA